MRWRFIVSSERSTSGALSGVRSQTRWIGAGAESAAGAGEDDAAHAVVGFGGAQALEQRFAQRHVERVALVGAVHRENAHRAMVFDQ
jgi:hypothetical protein